MKYYIIISLIPENVVNIDRRILMLKYCYPMVEPVPWINTGTLPGSAVLSVCNYLQKITEHTSQDKRIWLSDQV